jgi:hypothetical protein
MTYHEEQSKSTDIARPRGVGSGGDWRGAMDRGGAGEPRQGGNRAAAGVVAAGGAATRPWANAVTILTILGLLTALAVPVVASRIRAARAPGSPPAPSPGQSQLPPPVVPR